MKTTLLTFLLSCSLSFVSFSQKITPKDLPGHWDIQQDTLHKSPLTSWNFIDSRHVEWSNGLSTLPMLLYILDTASNPVMMKLAGEDSVKFPLKTYWFIKLNADTLKIQGSFAGVRPTKWELPETFRNTGILIKRKGG